MKARTATTAVPVAQAWVLFILFLFLARRIERYTYSVKPLKIINLILDGAGFKPCPKVHYLFSLFKD
jgi:hypothetical protein